MWEGRGLQRLHRLERPQLFVVNGVPSALFCAVDETPAREFSYNVHIPLRREGDQKEE